MIFLQVDSLASRFPWQESDGAWKMSDSSFRKCYELSENLTRLGLLVKTYLESYPLQEERFVKIWSVKDTMSPFLILKLRVSVQSTEGSEYFLWRTPDAHCDRGMCSKDRFLNRRKRDMPIHFWKFWLTPIGSDGFRSTFRRESLLKEKENGSLSSQIAHFEAEEGGLNPAWVEQMMGFPVGWTEVTKKC